MPHFPHVAEALEFVRRREKAQQVKRDLARRTYMRSIHLGELPPGGAPALVEAIDELGITPGQFAVHAGWAMDRYLKDAQQKAHSAKTHEAIAFAKSEDPNWRPGLEDEPGRPFRPSAYAAERLINQGRRLHELREVNLKLWRERAPDVFGDVFGNYCSLGTAPCETPVDAPPPVAETSPAQLAPPAIPATAPAEAAAAPPPPAASQPDGPDIVAAVPGIPDRPSTPAPEPVAANLEW